MKIEVKEESPSYSEDPFGVDPSSQLDDKTDIKPLMKFSSPNNKKAEDPNYHWCYKKSAQAEIPAKISDECDEDDSEIPVVTISDRDIPAEHINELKQALSHLSIDVILSIYNACNCDLDCTIRNGKQLMKIDLVPDYVKRIIRANIAVERSGPKSNSAYKVQHFVSMFKNVVDAKSITEFYYSEKNKINNDWRLQKEERVMTETEKQELEEKLAKCDITIIEQKPKTGKRKNRKFRRGPSVEETSGPSCSNGSIPRSTPSPTFKTTPKTVRKTPRTPR